MKANNRKGNNIKRDEWQTPKELFNKLNNQYNFKFDCCSNHKNNKCLNYCLDFKSIDLIILNAWMNPPFSKSLEMFKHFFKVVIRGIAIYRCDNMETKIWQEVILPNASWIFIPKGRICYEGMEGNGSRFPSALIGFNLEEPKGLKGNILKCYK